MKTTGGTEDGSSNDPFKTFTEIGKNEYVCNITDYIVSRKGGELSRNWFDEAPPAKYEDALRRAATSSKRRKEMFMCECRPSYGSAGDDAMMSCCGPKSTCINRALMMECQAGECAFGPRCQNQRFQRAEYSPVEVVETPGKGFGLVAREPIMPYALIHVCFSCLEVNSSLSTSVKWSVMRSSRNDPQCMRDGCERDNHNTCTL